MEWNFHIFFLCYFCYFCLCLPFPFLSSPAVVFLSYKMLILSFQEFGNILDEPKVACN